MNLKILNGSFVKVRDLTKIYSMGEATVTALNGVHAGYPARFLYRGDGTIRLGEEYASLPSRRIGLADFRHNSIGGEEVEKMDEYNLAEFRRNRIGFIFQSFNLVSSMAAIENVGFPLRFFRRAED
jgi:putative ABC transport system ATP-binding protein